MHEKVIIDTNVLIYDTYEDSINHEEASSLLNGLETWVIPLIVLYEYIWFLKGMGESTRTAEVKLEDYVLSEKAKILREGASHLRKALHSLTDEGIPLSKFNDEVILVIAKEEGLALATFDSRMKRRARKRGIRIVP